MDADMGTADGTDSYEAIPFYIGHHERQRRENVTEELFHHAEDLGYDFLTASITNDNYRPRVLEHLSTYLRSDSQPTSDHKPPFPSLTPISSAETDTTPSEVSSRLLFTVSTWIDVTSADPLIANISKQVLLQEIAYASFCGASNVLFAGPKSAKGHGLIANLATVVREALAAAPNLTVSMLMPMTLDAANGDESDHADLAGFTCKEYRGEDSQKQDPLGSWDVWHAVRNACKYDSRLCVALTIPFRLPPSYVLSRWASEPIRLLNIPVTSFTPNKHNVDVLTKSHQQLIARFLRQKIPPWLLLSGVGALPGLFTNADHSPHQQNGKPSAAELNFATLPPQRAAPHLMYLREHLQRHQPSRSALERYGAGFQDWPQNPLQPLADNLDSLTYEVFEKDPVKYAWYECAIRRALEDFNRRVQVSSGDAPPVVAVVGAGRGPLVHRVLQASNATEVPVDCWALEKNPSAFVHLQKRNKNEWGGLVHLVHSDMRSWTGPQGLHSSKDSDEGLHGIDILVSELLGSLGDNELSPECLDGVQHLLSSRFGLSIPSSYSAFATPVAAPELWRNVKYRTGNQGPGGLKHDRMMLPYVSWLHASDYLSTTLKKKSNPANGGATTKTLAEDENAPTVKKLWDFHHPIRQQYLEDETAKSNNHNERNASHTFHIPRRGVCHGIAGYFESVLYDCVTYNTSEGSNGTVSERVATEDAPEPWPLHPAKVILSTNPLTMPLQSPDMISWFPLFFPFKTPLYVPDDGQISISIWRKTTTRGVWYEWCADVFGPNGKCGESGWHSSEAVTCLM